MIELALLLQSVVFSDPEVWLVHRAKKWSLDTNYWVAAPSERSYFSLNRSKKNGYSPIEHYWIGIDPPIEDDVYGIACNADGAYMLISDIESLEYPGMPRDIPSDHQHESIEVTIIDRVGKPVGKLFDTTHLPIHMLDDVYLVRSKLFDNLPLIKHFVQPTDGAPVDVEQWDIHQTYVESVWRAFPCEKSAIYHAEPFIGFMGADYSFLTTPNWVDIRSLGDGFFRGYRLDHGVDLLDCEGRVLFILPAESYIMCQTADGFAGVLYDEHGNEKGVLLDHQGQIIGDHPFGVGMHSLPGALHLSYGYLATHDDQEDASRPVLWNNKAREFVSLPFEISNVDFPEDQSGVFQFTRKPDSKKTNTRDIVGLMNPDGSVRFQMRSSWEPWIRWEYAGSIVRGAGMYQAHHRDSTTHEYLICKDGQVLWKSPDAPDPEIEIMNIDD